MTHSRITHRYTRNNKFRTENRYTAGTKVAASTDDNGKTQVYLEFASGESLVLDGKEARSIYRVLAKHFGAVGKSLK